MSFSAFLCVLLVPGIFGQSLIPDRKPNVIDLDEAIKTIFTTPPNPSFLDEYEEVKGGRVKNGETFGAMPKCGEGEDRGVHICVPYYLCNPKNNTVTQTGVTDGFGVIEIRFGYNSCNHPLEVCCSVPRNTQNNGKLYTSPEIKINTRPSATTSTLVTTTPLTSPFRRTRPLNTLFVSNNISFANTNQTNETLTTTTIINDPSTSSTTASTPLTRPTFRSHRIRLLTIRPSKLFPSIRRIANLTISYVSKDVNKTKSTTTTSTTTRITTTPTTTEDDIKTTTTENTTTVLNTTPFAWQKSRTRSTQRPTITPSQYQVVEENDLPSESDLTLNRETTTITTPPIGPTQPLFTPSIKSSRRRNFVCGIRHPDGIDFKLTGNHNNEAEYGEFPWMTAILRRDAVDTPQAICGGSLITPNVVLTGAHCVYTYEENEIKIRVGEWDTQTENERLPYQERNVTSIVLHDDFDYGTLNNDIALLILDRSVKEADNVGTVCLPPQDLVFDSKECFASGWGKDVFGKLGQSQVILKKIQLPIVSRRKCQYSLRKTRLGKSFNLHESFICAGGEEGKDTCTGDGGSPLVCPDPLNPERYFQAGVVAWGIGCGTRNVPGVYADVSHFRNWIDKQLQKLEIDIRAYLS